MIDSLAVVFHPRRINLDFARGNNQGIAQAQGRYIVTLNNDTEADERWLEEWVRDAESAEDVGRVALRIALFDRHSCQDGNFDDDGSIP